MQPGRPRTVAWVIGMWLGAHVVLIAGHVLLVFLYSAFIEPGLSNAEYQAFARASGPWFSIVFGFPAFYAVGRILSGRMGPSARVAGLAVWCLYSATDLAIVLAYEESITALLAVQWCVSQGVKVAGVLWATRAFPRGDG